MNHQNSEQVLNENIIIIHPLIAVAVDQHKDFSRCMESKAKDHKRYEEMEMVGLRRKPFCSEKITVAKQKQIEITEECHMPRRVQSG